MRQLARRREALRDWAALGALRLGRKGWLCRKRLKDLSVGMIQKLGGTYRTPCDTGLAPGSSETCPQPRHLPSSHHRTQGLGRRDSGLGDLKLMSLWVSQPGSSGGENQLAGATLRS